MTSGQDGRWHTIGSFAGGRGWHHGGGWTGSELAALWHAVDELLASRHHPARFAAALDALAALPNGQRVDPNPHLDGATQPAHLAERVVECGTTRTITCDACHWTHVVTCRRPAAHREPGGYLPDGHVSDPLHPACEHHAFTIWKDA